MENVGKSMKCLIGIIILSVILCVWIDTRDMSSVDKEDDLEQQQYLSEWSKRKGKKK